MVWSFLNEIYNLSFVIKEVKYQKNIQKMELISSDDKEQKKEKRKKLNSETKEFYNQVEQKFQGCLPLKTLKKSFSLGELTRLDWDGYRFGGDLKSLPKLCKVLDWSKYSREELCNLPRYLKHGFDLKEHDIGV